MIKKFKQKYKHCIYNIMSIFDMLQDVYLVYPDQFAINARMFKTIILY